MLKQKTLLPAPIPVQLLCRELLDVSQPDWQDKHKIMSSSTPWGSQHRLTEHRQPGTKLGIKSLNIREAKQNLQNCRAGTARQTCPGSSLSALPIKPPVFIHGAQSCKSEYSPGQLYPSFFSLNPLHPSCHLAGIGRGYASILEFYLCKLLNYHCALLYNCKRYTKSTEWFFPNQSSQHITDPTGPAALLTSVPDMEQGGSAAVLPSGFFSHS